MKPLVNFYDGEPWFDNPQLVIANPKRRKKTMSKRRTRRGRKNAPRRRARRNFYSAGMLSNRPRRKARRNPRRRRHMRSNAYFPLGNPRRKHRKHYRRNPGGGRKFLGFTLPPMDEVLFATAGLIGPGLVAGKILSFLPASWQTGSDGKPNQITMWATKVLSVVLPAWAIRRFIGTRASNSFLIGGLAGLSLDAIKTFAPGIIPGIGAQPLLGSYFDQPRAVVNFPRSTGRVPQMIADAPGRLDPQERY